MNLGHRYRVIRPPAKAKFPISESLIERQQKARAALGDMPVKADRFFCPPANYPHSDLHEGDVGTLANRPYVRDRTLCGGTHSG